MDQSKIPFPGEQKFSVNQSENFVPRGTEFVSGSGKKFRSPGNKISWLISRKISFPGEQKFSVNQSENFVPRGTKFPGGSVEKFCSPGNEISL